MYGLTCVHTLCRNNKAEYRDVTAKHLRLYNNDVFLRLSLFTTADGASVNNSQ